jgi:hypothetical protein
MKKEILVCAVAIFVVLISACVSETQIIPMPTDKSTETPIPLTSTLDYTPTAKPTSTSRPTHTATPVPDWITSFAQPILNVIKDKPPRFEDDFSNAASQWSTGRTEENLNPQSATQDPGQHIFGQTGYIDGEYFTTADPVSCVGGDNRRIGVYKDFVAEFDTRFVSGTQGGLQIQFHRNEIGLYSVNMDKRGDTWIGKCAKTSCGAITEYSGYPPFDETKWNHFTIVVRIPKMAVFANGIPIMYVEDTKATQEFETGKFSLTVCNFGGSPMEIRWDNLKIWDISNLP